MRIRWYFDFISPFAYLHWPKVRALAERQPVEFMPLLLAGLLEANGQKGPAEIPAKRRFTYRHALWLAREQGLPLNFPPAHPFNPLLALRLCIAAGTTPEAISAIFNWIWAEGRAGDSLDALAPLIRRFGIEDPALLSDPAVKATLRGNFDQAVAENVFGVPTLSLDGELFWGNDAHGFALASIDDPGLLGSAEMQRVDQLPVGAARRP
jgi:2-hydroxychromene-2-carboxylate isomerase